MGSSAETVSVEEESNRRVRPKARVESTDINLFFVLNYHPKFTSQECYEFVSSLRQDILRTDRVEISCNKGKSNVPILFLDWHQAIGRGTEGKTDFLQKVPESNLRYARNILDKADQFNRSLIIIVLSFKDTDKTRDRTLGYIKASGTDNICSLYSRAIIVRKDRVRREGKAAAISDLLRRQDYRKALAISSMTQLKYLARSVPICFRYRVHRSNFRGRPVVQSTDILQRKWLVDTFPLVEDWLRC